MANIYDMSDVWSDGGTTFTAIKMDVTDTDSASGSLLMDLQVGGSSKFKADKNSSVSFLNGSFSIGSSGVGPGTLSVEHLLYGRYLLKSGNTGFLYFAGNILVGESAFHTGVANLGFGSTPNSNVDIFLKRDAAGTLAQRNGSNAQTFNIYNTYTDASNYERGFMKWNSNVLEIGTEHSNGNARAISLVVAGSQRLSVNSAGNIALGSSATSTGSSGGSTSIGRLSVASGAYSVAIGHGVSTNTGPEATGSYSTTIAAGYASRKSTASAIVSSIFGGSSALADKFGQNAYGLYGFGAQGDAQISTLGFVGSTADATPTEVFLFGQSNQRAVIPANTTWAFVLTAIARSSGGTDNAMYIRRGVIKRDGANNTSLVGTVDAVYTNETDAAWDIAITADDTNESLKVEVTGAAATDIRWVVKVELTEVAYA